MKLCNLGPISRIARTGSGLSSIATGDSRQRGNPLPINEQRICISQPGWHPRGLQQVTQPPAVAADPQRGTRERGNELHRQLLAGRKARTLRQRDGQLTMGQLLFGRWLFLVILGFCQVTIMFVWASIAFGLDLWSPKHLTGFLIVTAATAAAAAGPAPPSP